MDVGLDDCVFYLGDAFVDELELVPSLLMDLIEVNFMPVFSLCFSPEPLYSVVLGTTWRIVDDPKALVFDVLPRDERTVYRCIVEEEAGGLLRGDSLQLDLQSLQKVDKVF